MDVLLSFGYFTLAHRCRPGLQNELAPAQAEARTRFLLSFYRPISKDALNSLPPISHQRPKCTG